MLRCLLMTAFLSGAVGIYAQFGGGSGTSADPYLVVTAAHLNNVRNYRSSCFLQTADINLNVAPYNSGQGWNPIGSPVALFTGSYDGGEHTIANLYVNRDYSFMGLFGQTSNATLRRIRFTNACVSSPGSGWIGTLSAKCVNTVIEDCLAGTQVNGDAYVGGLVGEVSGGSMTRCRADAVITFGEALVANLVGCATNCTISSCCAFGPNAGHMNAGGLLGDANNCIISDCFSQASLTGMIDPSGLIGNLYGGSVTNCYFAGTISNGGNGLIGYSSGTVTHSYWDTQSSGTNASEGGEGRTTDQMTYSYAANTYVDWDFASVWSADSTSTENSGYPYLSMQYQGGVVILPTFSHPAGYYNASFLLTLQTITGSATIHYTLDGSEPNPQSPVYTTPLPIDASTIVKAYATRTDWVASSVVSAAYYLGIFESGTGTLQNPYLVSTPAQLDGVRHAPDACFRQTNDIHLDVAPYNSGTGWNPICYFNSQADHQDFTGSYDGGLWRIRNLFMNANCERCGLFGYAVYAELRNIRVVDADIHGGNHTGGLVGFCTSSSIDKCSVSGSVHGTTNTGGLGGYVSASTVTNCFSSATVSGTDGVAGLIATLEVESDISDCYSRSVVSTSGTSHGGLFNYVNTPFVTIYQSYWDVQVSGQSTSAGGEGRTTVEMTYPYPANTYVGWDFPSLWQPDVEWQNSGYPFFYRRVQHPVFSHPEITPGEPVLVTITCPTPACDIRYSLVDTEPDEGSALYTHPFWVAPDADSLVFVYARAFHEDLNPSYTNVVALNFSAVPVSDPTASAQLSLRAWPNPFFPSCRSLTLEAKIPPGGHQPVSLTVYNLRGQSVLVTEIGACSTELAWDGRDRQGNLVPPGIYLIRLSSGSQFRTLKVLVQ